jgi:hypothetical protein
MRPVREAYARVEVPWFDEGTGDQVNIELGLELRPGDDWGDLVTGLHALVEGWVDGEPHPRDVVQIGEEIEALLKLAHPDRAYFIEVWPPGDRGWVQIFQPYGLPRSEEAPCPSS